VRPDGYGVWSEAGSTIPFLLEYDNGTERLGRLTDKLGGYAKLAAAAGHRNWVLFTFGTPRREHEARRVLSHSGVLVATCARILGVTPNGPIWRPVGGGDAPVRLIELADADSGTTWSNYRPLGGA